MLLFGNYSSHSLAQDMRTQLEDRQSGVELDVKEWQLRCIQF